MRLRYASTSCTDVTRPAASADCNSWIETSWTSNPGRGCCAPSDAAAIPKRQMQTRTAFIATDPSGSQQNTAKLQCGSRQGTADQKLLTIKRVNPPAKVVAPGQLDAAPSRRAVPALQAPWLAHAKRRW